MVIFVHVIYEHMHTFHLGKYLEVKLLDHRLDMYLMDIVWQLVNQYTLPLAINDFQMLHSIVNT